MRRLSEAHIAALSEVPSYGFSAGSNMWPLVCVGKDKIDGEYFDELLRSGYLVATPLPEPVLTDRTPDAEYAPDCECTHELNLTSAGRSALAQSNEKK